MLAKKFDLDNLSQAGCSEYKIRQQLNQVDLTEYTHCIVTHTSPWRIPVEKHPLHQDDALHFACDLIYADILASNDKRVDCAKEFFAHYYHKDFYEYIYKLIAQDINQLLLRTSLSKLEITFFDTFLETFDRQFHVLFKHNKGDVNHLSDKANKLVYEHLVKWIEIQNNVRH